MITIGDRVTECSHCFTVKYRVSGNKDFAFRIHFGNRRSFSVPIPRDTRAVAAVPELPRHTRFGARRTRYVYTAHCTGKISARVCINKIKRCFKDWRLANTGDFFFSRIPHILISIGLNWTLQCTFIYFRRSDSSIRNVVSNYTWWRLNDIGHLSSKLMSRLSRQGTRLMDVAENAPIPKIWKHENTNVVIFVTFPGWE